MRHGDIDDVEFKIRLDFIRDFRNVLNLLTKEDEVSFIEQLARDKTRQKVAKLATRNFKMGGQESVLSLQKK
jgi:hypothetical protein